MLKIRQANMTYFKIIAKTCTYANYNKNRNYSRSVPEDADSEVELESTTKST